MITYQEEQNLLFQTLFIDAWNNMEYKIINIFTGTEEYYTCGKACVQNSNSEILNLNMIEKNFNDLLLFYQDQKEMIDKIKYSFSQNSEINEIILTKLLEYANIYKELECTIPDILLTDNNEKVFTLLSALKNSEINLQLKILVINNIDAPENYSANFDIEYIEYLISKESKIKNNARLFFNIFEEYGDEDIRFMSDNYPQVFGTLCDKKSIINIYLPTLSLYFCENMQKPQYEYGRIRFKDGKLSMIENNVPLALWAWRGKQELNNVKCDRCQLNNICSFPCYANALRLYNDPTFPDDSTCHIQDVISRKER